jgi:APA family basic amino acid/polyamine antiporter
MANLFRKKTLADILEHSVEGGHTLKRTLGSLSLIALGIGAIIGAGIFVRTATAAGNHAGSAVVLSFILAGIGCAFAGLCYAEMAAMIPVAGSAYTYAYATVGELVAWIIGWDLVLEYALGAATVSIAWSEYLNKLLQTFGYGIPYQWCHSPFESVAGVHGIVNIPALCILAVLSLLLMKGTQESALVNSIIVGLKLAIVITFIAIGWHFIDPANHTPFLPENTGSFGDFGWSGVLRGAGIVFFAYIGFDAVSTAAQEARNPQKGMPIGILGSLVLCTILYILFSWVLTGVASYKDFSSGAAGHEASVAYAIEHHMPGYAWLATAITVAILAGFSSVILVLLLGQSRVFYSLSHDGLMPKIFSELHPKWRTPWKSNMLLFVLVGLFGGFVPEDVVGDMTSIGTLFAFVLVCVAVIVMRKQNRDAHRPFRAPFVPVVPIMGILVCGAMILGEGWENWTRLIVWLVIGFVIYFSYGVKHSRVGKMEAAGPSKAQM